MRWFSTGLWQSPDFLKLWTGQTVSVFGSWMTNIALPLTAVLVLAATPAQMGLLAAIGAAPVLLIGLLAGVWVDRLRRRPILILADLARASILGSVPVAAMLGLLRIEQLYVVAGSVGVLTVFFDVAYQSYLPSLVSRDRLMEGNSKLEASSSAVEVGGPAIAGVLVQWISAPMTILLDALSFLFSALCLGLIRTPEPPPMPPEERQDLWQDIVEGLRVILGNPLLRAIAGSSGTRSFFGGFFGTLYTLYAIRELGFGPALLGVVIGVGGVGSLVGAILSGRAVRRFGLGTTVIGTVILGGALQLLVPLAGGPVIVAASLLSVAQLLGDAAIIIYLITALSLRQAIVPGRLLGRANASMQFLMRGMGPIGALVAGVLGEVIGLRPTLLVAALGFVLASLWVLFSPIRALREQPEPAGEPNVALG